MVGGGSNSRYSVRGGSRGGGGGIGGGGAGAGGPRRLEKNGLSPLLAPRLLPRPRGMLKSSLRECQE
jgi:hypothetical protein